MLLNELNMSREEIATALGVSRRTVESWFAKGESRRNMPKSIRIHVEKLVNEMYLNRNLTSFLQSSEFQVVLDSDDNYVEKAQAKFQMNFHEALDIKFDGIGLNLGINFAYLNYENGCLSKSWIKMKTRSYDIHDAFFKDAETLVLLTEAGWIEINDFPSEFKAWYDSRAI